MIDHDQDERVIEPDADVYNATLVRRVDLTADLGYFWVRMDGDATPFEAGQYMTTGVMTDGRILQRPYSVASAPSVANTEGYEIFVRLVPINRFTTALWRLPVGHRMRVIGPKGKFMLEPDDDRTHLYVSTGTGIAPVHRDDPRDDDAGHAAQDGAAQRLLVRRRARLPGRARGLAGRPGLPAALRPIDLAPERPAQRRLDGPHRPGRGGRHARSAGSTASSPTRRSSTSAATPR